MNTMGFNLCHLPTQQWVCEAAIGQSFLGPGLGRSKFASLELALKARGLTPWLSEDLLVVQDPGDTLPKLPAAPTLLQLIAGKSDPAVVVRDGGRGSVTGTLVCQSREAGGGGLFLVGGVLRFTALGVRAITFEPGRTEITLA